MNRIPASRSPRPHRRLLSAIGLASASVLVLSACGGGGGEEAAEIDLGSGPPQAGQIREGALEGLTLTFASYGGIYQDAQESSLQDFPADSGATVLQDGPMEYAKIQAQVESNNVTWDVVDLDATWGASQCGEDGILQPVNTDIVDTSAMPEGSVSECYVPAMEYANLMVYNTEQVDTAPTGFADFFDTEKFPGKRAVNGSDVGPLIEAALLADGVPQEELYPLDMDRALAKLDTIKDDIVFWDTGAQSQQMLEAQEVALAFLWNGRAMSAVKNGAPYEPVWDASVSAMDVLAVPENAKNPEASWAMINYMVGPEQQEVMAEESSYAVIHADAKPDLDEITEKFNTANPENAEKITPFNYEWWGENYNELLDQYLAWVQS